MKVKRPFWVRVKGFVRCSVAWPGATSRPPSVVKSRYVDCRRSSTVSGAKNCICARTTTGDLRGGSVHRTLPMSRDAIAASRSMGLLEL